MTTEENNNASPSFGKRMGSAFSAFVRALFRLAVIAFTLGILGVAIFYGVRLYSQYSLLQNNLTTIERNQARQNQANQIFEQSLAKLEERVNALEVQNDNNKQAIDALRESQTSMEKAQEAFLKGLESTQTANEAQTEAINAALQQLENQLTHIETAIGQNSDQIVDVEAQVQELESQYQAEEAPITALRREVQLLKAMELLTRSRLSLVESNLGLAAEDIQAARDLIDALQVPGYQVDTKNLIVGHLDMALDNLPDSPILAAENLEIAWQLLKDGLPGEPPLSVDQGTITPTPEESAITATPEESTVTATPTPTPSPTP